MKVRPAREGRGVGLLRVASKESLKGTSGWEMWRPELPGCVGGKEGIGKEILCLKICVLEGVLESKT